MEKYQGKQTPDAIQAVGKLDILKRKKLAFFCSIKCPGDLILKTYDLARDLQNAGVAVAGGFHSPMEKQRSREGTI
jgi:hypothetical protein